jgi:hypothetical protein
LDAQEQAGLLASAKLLREALASVLQAGG